MSLSQEQIEEVGISLLDSIEKDCSNKKKICQCIEKEINFNRSIGPKSTRSQTQRVFKFMKKEHERRKSQGIYSMLKGE